jgi:hypothetical protein
MFVKAQSPALLLEYDSDIGLEEAYVKEELENGFD